MRKQIIRLIIALVFLAGLVGLGVLEWKECKEKIEWQTYTSPDYGYSIEYPSDWYLSQKNNELLIKNTDKSLDYDISIMGDKKGQDVTGYSINIIAYENTKDLSLEEYINLVFEGEPVKIMETRLETFASINPLKVLEAYEAEGIITYWPRYFLERNGYIYEIRCRDQYRGVEDIAGEIIWKLKFEK